MKIDQDTGIDDEGGGQVDGSTHVVHDAVREKAAALRRERPGLRVSAEIQGHSSYAISRPVAATCGSAMIAP